MGVSWKTFAVALLVAFIAADAKRGGRNGEGEGGEGKEGKGGRRGGRVGKRKDCTMEKVKDKLNSMVAKAEEKGTALNDKLEEAETELGKEAPVCEDIEIPVGERALKFFEKMGCGDEEEEGEEEGSETLKDEGEEVEEEICSLMKKREALDVAKCGFEKIAAKVAELKTEIEGADDATKCSEIFKEKGKAWRFLRKAPMTRGGKGGKKGGRKGGKRGGRGGKRGGKRGGRGRGGKGEKKEEEEEEEEEEEASR